MKIREAIETVDRLLPNQYETPDKVRWLSELDGIVYRDIICTHEHEKQPEPFTGYGGGRGSGNGAADPVAV